MEPARPRGLGRQPPSAESAGTSAARPATSKRRQDLTGKRSALAEDESAQRGAESSGLHSGMFRTKVVRAQAGKAAADDTKVSRSARQAPDDTVWSKLASKLGPKMGRDGDLFNAVWYAAAVTVADAFDSEADLGVKQLMSTQFWSRFTMPQYDGLVSALKAGIAESEKVVRREPRPALGDLDAVSKQQAKEMLAADRRRLAVLEKLYLMLE